MENKTVHVHAEYVLFGCLVLLANLSLVSGLCSKCLGERCHDNGECIIGCVTGYVGKYCEEACPSRCLNKVCHRARTDGTITCTDGCEHGKCGDYCLELCPEGCETCDRQCGSCNMTLCPERHYGADCSDICSAKYGKCDRETGQCIICRRGYYGDECNQKCTHCHTRADTISYTCLSGCDVCQDAGTCPTGFSGDSCKFRCLSGCVDTEGCNRATGECSIGCVSGYYGLFCNHTCIGNCQSGKCKRETGECLNGCVPGYHGLTCNKNCSSLCVGRNCHQYSGVCTSGCAKGYIPNGDMCEKYSSDTTEGSSWAIDNATFIILVCFVSVVAIVKLRRQIRRSKRVQISHDQNESAVLLLPKESDEVQDLKTRTMDEIAYKTAEMDRVLAVDIVLDKLKGQRLVTITGHPGDGKSTLGFLVLNEFLQQNVNVFNVHKPEEYHQIANLKEKRVIMFDDVFSACHETQRLRWFEVITHFYENDNQNMQAIFVSRINDMKEARMYLEQLTSRVFEPKFVVDLSKECDRN